ncbi:MAG: polysaccharide pyruvyl transferase family protein [Mesorhizobium sp.]|uniref:polysaccharide pyruvyl transferase family protein n=1 Tax=Mesorhizobium sp. TaxID=1871066 RepID=UPI00122498B2|nr:polysaccharide pyruvyl transferase family protein [Mesorhizobium sp.]TIQ21142.1 MAG: polysaccharide pyruvyl transferase family protein [Mesorhizobium sp.]
MRFNHRPIQILVEPSDYVLRNIGDMAMLYAATERLTRLCDNSTINVLTDDPDALRRFCPFATPLSAEGRALWLKPDFRPAKLKRFVPKHWPDRIRRHAPRLVSLFWRLKLRHMPDARAALLRFTDAVDRADLVLVSGMGGITDAFPEYALSVLETLNLALARKGRPVVMVGQGMGPLANAELRARASAILPRLHLIALRETRAGLPLLAELGVSKDRICATGDDAIEMAHEMRLDELGTGIGVNLRLSSYSGVSADILEGLRHVLGATSDSLEAPLIGVPVSWVPREADIDSIRGLMPTDETELNRALAIRTPIDLIRQIQRCRVVVTGSYHAGVFALANGIPTIGLARSDYYVDKFLGLADMFGTGCEMVALDHPNSAEKLRSALRRLWEEAPAIRPAILARAEAQIAAGHTAYRRIRDAIGDQG